MGKYGEEEVVVDLSNNLVSEVVSLDLDVTAVDSNSVVDSVVDDNAVQETAKQGMSVFGMHMLYAAVAAIGILAAILLLGGLLNKINENNPEKYVDYEGNVHIEGNTIF